MAIQIYKRSRLRFKELLDVYGVTFWELDNLPAVPEQSDDVYYQVKYDDRIDLLAQVFYGEVGYWWIIAVANGMEVLPTDLIPGSVIRIPSPSYVLNDLYRNALV